MNLPEQLPTLAIGSLGGTVCMQCASPGAGAVPRLDCQALLESVPELGVIARVTATTLCLLPSASLGFTELLKVLQWATTAVEEGAHAVVLTQGTDSLEETAYFLELLWPFEAPLVLTGAMRSASQPGGDGPANLLAAAQVALALSSRGRGVQVVMNDQIHAAARVRKVDSLAVAAFASPGFGPQGRVVEGHAVYSGAPLPRVVLPLPRRTTQRVALLEACLEGDTLLLEQITGLGYEGLVIAGFGAGHVPASWAQPLETIARKLCVVVATRTGSGPTATHGYGFAGGEIDMLKRGVRMAGSLCPRKCRVLMWLLLGCDLVRDIDRILAPPV
jgi:L-asparaginase